MGFVNALFYGIVALNALFATVTWCVVAPSRRSLLAAVGCALVWPFVNGPLEGQTLFVFSREHGFTVSDVFTFIALAIAAAQYRKLRAASRGRRRHPDTDDAVGPSYESGPIRRP